MKQHLLRNKEPMPHQPHTQPDMPFISQTATLSSKQHPVNKRQKIVFNQQYIPVIDLTRPQNSPIGVSFSNKELIVRRETPTTQQETYYTHLNLPKPQTQSQIQESAQTQLRKQQLSDQDISHFRLILSHDRQKQLAHQQSIQDNTPINIWPNPQMQLPSHEHQKECLPSYQDPLNFKSLNSIANQPSQSTNLLLNISSQLSQSHTSSLDSSSQLTQSQTSLLNISSQLPKSQISIFLSSSQQSQKDTQLNREQASRESVLPGDLQSLEVSGLQMSQSQNSLLDIFNNEYIQLTQPETSTFLGSSQQSQKDTELNREQASCDSVFPSDLQSFEVSGLQMPQSPNVLLDISSQLSQSQTSPSG